MIDAAFIGFIFKAMQILGDFETFEQSDKLLLQIPLLYVDIKIKRKWNEYRQGKRK